MNNSLSAYHCVSQAIMGPSIVLQSSDGVQIPVSLHAADHSTFLKSMLEHFANLEEKIIPIDNYRSEDLRPVCEWLERLPCIPGLDTPTERRPPMVGPPMVVMDNWKMNFFTNLKEESTAAYNKLFAVTRVASFFGVDSLIYYAGAYIASLVKELETLEDVRLFFGMEDDLTDEERNEVRNSEAIFSDRV
uniref:Skp1_POZ domain-containing protein n=1 Tax=Steinernema glaseri TaxID=37863 RepID=A0A1I8A3K8_9BILA